MPPSLISLVRKGVAYWFLFLAGAATVLVAFAALPAAGLMLLAVLAWPEPAPDVREALSSVPEAGDDVVAPTAAQAAELGRWVNTTWPKHHPIGLRSDLLSVGTNSTSGSSAGPGTNWPRGRH